MTVLLVSLSARGGGEEIAVTFEIRSGEHTQRETLVIGGADVADLGLVKGEVSPACYDAVLDASARHTLRKRALNMLSYGRCSRRRLVQKLCAKGAERDLAQKVAARLAEEGYLDEGADALREAERNFEKLWGERRIAADLRAKGYGDVAIKEALASLRENGADYEDACARRIRQAFGELPRDPKEKQKAIASLTRAGFSFSEICEGAKRAKDFS